MAAPRHPQRRKAEQLLAEGRSPAEVAEVCGTTPRSVRRWRRAMADTSPVEDVSFTSSLHSALRTIRALGCARLEDLPDGNLTREVIARDLLDLRLVRGSMRSGLRLTEEGLAQLEGRVIEGETDEDRRARTAERVARHRERRRRIRVPAGRWSEPLPEGTWAIERVEEDEGGECFVVLVRLEDR